MYPLIFGRFSTYEVIWTFAPIIGVILFLTLMYQRTKSIGQSLINLAITFVLISIGARAAAILRTINTMDFVSVRELLLESKGNHFLGRVLAVSWLQPIVYLIFRKLDYRSTRDATAIFFVIQHFFNRIGCGGRGCCFGKTYYGIGAVTIPDVGSVYPVQLIEVAWMFLLLIVLLILRCKKRPLLGITLSAFGFVIFIDEFITNQIDVVHYYGMNAIQYAAILCMITGIIYICFEYGSFTKKEPVQ